MNQIKNEVIGQILYLGRWVEKRFFRAFVYNKDGQSKLAENFTEFEKMVSSGLWFETEELAKKALVPNVVDPIINTLETAIVSELPLPIQPIAETLAQSLVTAVENSIATPETNPEPIATTEQSPTLTTQSITDVLKSKFDFVKSNKKAGK